MKIEFNATQHAKREPSERVVQLPVSHEPKVIDYQKLAEDRKAQHGRFAWSKKHGYLGCDPQWHEIWVLLIPAFGCTCKQSFADYCNETPPDFSSPEAYWLWGVALHNHVNRKLGKPELTIEEARLQWSRLDDLEHKQG